MSHQANPNTNTDYSSANSDETAFYPPPPYYFSLFDSPHFLAPPPPPPVPDETEGLTSTTSASATAAIGDRGLDTAVDLSSIFPYLNSQINSVVKSSDGSASHSTIRQELSGIADDILKISLSMVSNFSVPNSSINAAQTSDMNSRLMSLVSSFHEKLAGYREHEATELLRIELKKQLDEAKFVRDGLKELLTKHGSGYI